MRNGIHVAYLSLLKNVLFSIFAVKFGTLDALCATIADKVSTQMGRPYIFRRFVKL